MNTQLIELIISALGGGVLTTFIDRFFLSRKDKNEYAIKLINALQKEIDRLNKKQDEMEIDFKEKYNSLLKEHNFLLEKHNALKKELDKYKSQN